MYIDHQKVRADKVNTLINACFIVTHLETLEEEVKLFEGAAQLLGHNNAVTNLLTTTAQIKRHCEIIKKING